MNASTETDAATHPSKQLSFGAEMFRLAGFLAATLIGIPVALVVLLFIGGFFYTSFVPAYSAEHVIAEVGATVGLRFYWIWDEMKDNGRYLTVTSPRGSVSQKLCGFDWAHWSRTSVYLTEDRKIAVLGPQGCDYAVAIDSLRVMTVYNVPSDKWTYLGAFQIVGYRPNTSLRFIDAAEQEECIEGRGLQSVALGNTRMAARKDRCEPPRPKSR